MSASQSFLPILHFILNLEVWFPNATAVVSGETEVFIRVVGFIAKGSIYLICGNYCDERQHFTFNYQPVIKSGLKGLYEKALLEISKTESQEEISFLQSVCQGLLAIKSMSEKFSDLAKFKLHNTTDPFERKNLQQISDSAIRVPWEAPTTFYEVLNTYAFLRMAVGSLEGVGLNTFGRVDVDLYPFYLNDIAKGRLTPDEAFDLICQFLLIWDCRYDPDKKMVYYSDHEYENTYTLGGCDSDGNVVFNTVTAMFLKATMQEKVIYPKIKCRFGKETPKEYFDLINAAIIKGTSTVLYQNDEATIPALVKAGRSINEARNYIVSGCWDVKSYGCEKPDAGAYINILKVFEFSIHNRIDNMEQCGITFQLAEKAESFEDLYEITVRNIGRLFKERSGISKMGRVWKDVDPHPIISSSLYDCLVNRKDYTAGGTRYNDEVFCIIGFPNIVDSLLAIKKLCFDSKQYSLIEYLNAVRHNWQNHEIMRRQAIACPCWGDGSNESGIMATRLSEDIYLLTQGLKSRWDGNFLIGHLTYTEIKWWGMRTLATPDGRFSGDYISQGLTPSRLNKINNAITPINSFRALDMSKCAGNSVVNIILPPIGIDLNKTYDYMLAVAQSGVQSLQLNCFSKEQLLDARQHPEKYPDLIVRVCGFSAKFTSLSPEWQDEVITRNFYLE